MNPGHRTDRTPADKPFTWREKIRHAVLAALGFAVLALPLSAQDTLPRSTIPADRVVFRGDKTEVEQQTDQLFCCRWATEQTRWDPDVEYGKLQSEYGAALDQYGSAQGAAVGGAARGALGGLVIGAIAGHAGRGAAIGAVAGGLLGAGRGGQTRSAAQQRMEAAVGDFQTRFRRWDHWEACMDGKGYGVGEE